MSYCRWSSDNFKCDIYAYESNDGFVIHVAGNRIIGDPPKSDYNLILKKNATDDDREEFIRQEKIRSAWMDECKREAITLECAGESFTEDDLQSFYNRLIELRDIGYNFPDYVLEDIKFEMHNKEPTPEVSDTTQDKLENKS